MQLNIFALWYKTMWILKRFCCKRSKKKKKPNVTVAAAITTHMLHSFLVLVGVWSSIRSPVIQTSICLLFYWTEYCIFTKNYYYWWCLIWAIRTGLSDKGWNEVVAKNSALDCFRFFEQLAKFKKRVSWGVLWFPQSMKYCSAWGVLIGYLWFGCQEVNGKWTVNFWRYLKNVKMWYIFHKSINWLSFTSSGFHCHV